MEKWHKNDSGSSGERNWMSLNPDSVRACWCCCLGVVGCVCSVQHDRDADVCDL